MELCDFVLRRPMPIRQPCFSNPGVLRRIRDGNWLVIQRRQRRLVIGRNEQALFQQRDTLL